MRVGFILFILLFITIGLSCSFAFNFRGTIFGKLNCIKYNETDAKNQIFESLTITASLVAISFVVIGFLFETVRRMTQQTFEDFFRAANVYFVMAFCIDGILCLIVMNMLKNSVSIITLMNLALFSVYVTIGVVLWVSHLFYKVIKFFNPNSLSALSKDYLLRAAKFMVLNELLAFETEIVCKELFESSGFEEYNYFLFDGDREQIQPVQLNNRHDSRFLDLCIPSLRFALRQIKARAGENGVCEYSTLKHGTELNANYIPVHIPVGVRLQNYVLWAFRKSFYLTSNISDDDTFEQEKSKMTDKILNAANSGDTELLNHQFSDMDNLYSVYYQSK